MIITNTIVIADGIVKTVNNNCADDADVANDSYT